MNKVKDTIKLAEYFEGVNGISHDEAIKYTAVQEYGTGIHDLDDFVVGTKVKIIADWEKFFFCNGKLGTVTTVGVGNGLNVKFDKQVYFEDGGMQSFIDCDPAFVYIWDKDTQKIEKNAEKYKDYLVEKRMLVEQSARFNLMEL